MKSLPFLLLGFVTVLINASKTVGSVSALYSFVSDANTLRTSLIDRMAVALNRNYDSTTNGGMITIRTIEEIDGAAACSPTTAIATPTSTGSGTGCQRVTFDILSTANMTEYELRYRVSFWDFYFARRASDTLSQFALVIPPNSPSVANFTWISSTLATRTNWVQRLYPQDAWVEQTTACVSGTTCESLTVAPSMRYMHSSILYRSWNFDRDVLGHSTLCLLPGVSNSDCTVTCLSDMTKCAGATSMADYYARAAESAYWTSSFFNSDDGFPQRVADTHQSSCPTSCCGNRRKCMRTRDDVGRVVPFDHSYLLQFGGRTRQKLEIGGQDLYLHCESILAGLNITENQALSSCYEIQSDELWRLDIANDTWELMKPRTLEVDTFPVGRYAHAAALVIVPAASDLAATRRQYMYIFGGLSTDCTNGLCVDLWRYEIPWAAQAYWPSSFSRVPGNVWKKLKDCPFGGRHRHTMEATDLALYVFGGQQQGEWDERLLIYRIASDTWDLVVAEGYRYFTRSAVDYLGVKRSVNLTDFALFDESKDVLGETGILGSTGVHAPQFPVGRGDHSGWKIGSSIWVSNGFRAFDHIQESLDYPYYVNDMWEYSTSTNVWLQFFSNSSLAPLPRRGASVAVRDNVIHMFGGMNGDHLFADFWTLSGRHWQEFPQEFSPPGVAYHSLNYDANSDSFILIGGLNWTQSNLTLSDQLVDADRSCFATARALLKTVCLSDIENATCALQQAVETISSACEESVENFCCAEDMSIVETATNLTRLSDACTSICQEDSFTSELTIGFGEGVWIYTPFENCPCSGACYYSQCICNEGWTGPECAELTCPNSSCYFDLDTLESTCTHCSNNGICTAGQCTCNAGWTGSDCSQIDCVASCNGGMCLSDFPVHQCICPPGFSGASCDEHLCLNECSLAGTCVAGECICQENFFGIDCSVYIMSASSGVTHSVLWLVIFSILF